MRRLIVRSALAGLGVFLATRRTLSGEQDFWGAINLITVSQHLWERH
jgi:hypothetical protein